MIQNILVKILLAPFSLLYGLGISMRDFFYRKDLLKSTEFNIPTISIGNLSVGGAGKTPHIEYLIRLLDPYINVSTLSRGYNRKTKGFLFVQAGNTAEQVGDEPLQFKRKFKDIVVAIAESRSFAIPKMLMSHPDRQVVLLDDAFQHRSIKPSLNILLTEFNHPFTRDYLLPSGRLREWRSAYQRANIIIVSKCPAQMTILEKEEMITEIKPFQNQRIYFSYYSYLRPYFILNRSQELLLTDDLEILVICAIARTEYLLEYLNTRANTVKVIRYEDHHYFTKFDVSNLKTSFDKISSTKKVIITTEKDAMRLELHRKFILENQLPIFVIPIQVEFHFDEAPQFDDDIKKHLLNFR